MKPTATYALDLDAIQLLLGESLERTPPEYKIASQGRDITIKWFGPSANRMPGWQVWFTPDKHVWVNDRGYLQP